MFLDQVRVTFTHSFITTQGYIHYFRSVFSIVTVLQKQFLVLILHYFSYLDEISSEVSTCDAQAQQEKTSNISNSEVTTDEADRCPDPNVTITKQLSEEENVINTAVED